MLEPRHLTKSATNTDAYKMSFDRQPYSRTQVYMGDPSPQPKHMFVHVANLIAEVFTKDFGLLDVGAASGAFVQYALNRFPALRATGVDFDPELVREATRRVSGASFVVGDANQLTSIADQSFNAVTMTGTHSIFEDFRPSFSECIRATAAGGRVLITGLFNEYPVDAQIHWRYATKFGDAWHPGYNLFSKVSVASHLDAHPRVSGYRFLPFALPFDLAPTADPIRSWTESNASGQRALRNGIMPLHFETLLIDVVSA
jgi:SAM-dependent methyltransferase